METMGIKRQKSLSEMLRTIPQGIWYEIKTKDYKPNIVRGAASRLNKRGYIIKVTEIGCIDSVKVSRIK